MLSKILAGRKTSEVVENADESSFGEGKLPYLDHLAATTHIGLVAVEKLYARLLDEPTPADPIPREIEGKTRRELPIPR